ncbi:MAG: hypothetical protein K2Y21_08100 [Phycisphaerales bacterium]|nr:hypothetical protein [Phycisphaerales bacterium]
MKNLIAAALIAAVGASASAATIFSSSFEAPGFVTGNLNGQGGFLSASTPANLFQVGNTPGFALTGSQFVFVNTAAQTSSGSNWHYRDDSIPTVTGPNNIIRASVYTAVLNQTTAAVNRQSSGGVDLYDFATGGRIGGIRVRNDGAVTVLNSAGSAGTLGAGTVVGNAYNQVAVEADYGLGVVRFYINGIQINTSGLGATWANFNPANGFGDADLYTVRANTNTTTNSGGHTVLFDDFSITAIPTPGALAAMGFAGLIAARRRRA